MAERFNVIAGLSDHSMSMSVPVASVAMGAYMIEKHFILDRSMGGVDAPFSMEPNEFKQMVVAIREVEKALGGVCYELAEMSRKNRQFARSLFVVKDIKASDSITEENVRSIRPGHELSPGCLKDVLGRTVAKDIKRGTPLSWDIF